MIEYKIYKIDNILCDYKDNMSNIFIDNNYAIINNNITKTEILLYIKTKYNLQPINISQEHFIKIIKNKEYIIKNIYFENKDINYLLQNKEYNKLISKIKNNNILSIDIVCDNIPITISNNSIKTNIKFNNIYKINLKKLLTF